jgi:hypothetical protein
MAPIGSLRSPILIVLSTVLLAVGSTGATSRASGSANAQEASAGHGSISAEPIPPSNPEQKALSLELAAKGALFYGAWWCPACHQQKVLFGETAITTLPYVECDKTEAGRQRCSAAEIKAYPTWVMKDKPRLVGVQTLEELKTWLASPASR